MHSLRCRCLLIALLWVLTFPAAGPAGAHGRGSGTGAQPARLHEEAAVTARRYEAGRRDAAEQRQRARRIDELRDRERGRVVGLREDLGRIARARYRAGGGLPLSVQRPLTDDAEDSARLRRAARQAGGVQTVRSSRRTEPRLTAEEARALRALEALEHRTVRPTELGKGFRQRLERARWRLQRQADASVAAGRCRHAVRLGRAPSHSPRGWVAPVETYVLSAGFGNRGRRWAHRHTGQDFAVPIGTPVRAVGPGRVVRVACGGAFGIQVVLRHPDGSFTRYAHLASVAVERGERVTSGQWVGQSGSTGNSTGPHLHFEVGTGECTGSAVDPLRWLAARGVHVG
ncbi:M23 family metallopeptidase [Streptomyces sp. NPDC046831]|uniref:M23 family metallopeptidase n=1 Tax=Streptomyces sp. NPDC046831 TaxID=3154805 RepID=UPI0033DB30E2